MRWVHDAPASPETRTERVARPVLLTVDDDPAVSRSVARDLRRRYGEDYRIMRADSGAEALEAIRELVLRGEQVATILADYRMPQMNGVDFLEAGDGPGAAGPTGAAHRVRRHQRGDRGDQRGRRRPLPAQAVGAAGGEALPGDRRTARASGSAEGRRPEHKIKILGHPWSQASYEVRDFLARNLVPYRWYNVDDPDGARLLAAAGAASSQAPVVITTDGAPLIQPSLLELANAVGLNTTPQGEFYDLVIVGGGPAGLGAAVYAASEGLKTVVVERAAAGGQAGQSSRIENYLGFPDGVAGDQLTDRARRQALRFGAELLTARTVVGLEVQGPGRGR